MSYVKYRCRYCGGLYDYDEHNNEQCLSNPYKKTCITCVHYDLDYEITSIPKPDKDSQIRRMCKKTYPHRTIDQCAYDGVFERREGSVGWMCKEWDPIERREYAVWRENGKSNNIQV